MSVGEGLAAFLLFITAACVICGFEWHHSKAFRERRQQMDRELGR